MAGYRRVNYYELCRLCTSSEGTKMHIFREEGRRRSLPSKIQTCLPLQVQEEDALPKIICSSCVEKLENYFEFRESCINAEAMLESYFTSLRYSDDFPREGKVSVYVKEEPPKKKDESTGTKIKMPASSMPTTSMISSNTTETTVSSLQPTAIQILTDPDGNHVAAQYKVQVQGGIPALVPYGNQPGIPISLPGYPSVKQISAPSSITTTTMTSAGSISCRSEEMSDPTVSQHSMHSHPPPPPLVAAVTITPHTQELVQQFGMTAKDRNSSIQLGEMVKVKNINVLEPATYETMGPPVLHSGHMSNLMPAQIRLDSAQLSQLISANANLHINLGPMQDTVNAKVLNITSSRSQLVHIPKVETKQMRTEEHHQQHDNNMRNVSAVQQLNSNEMLSEKLIGSLSSEGIMTRISDQMGIKVQKVQESEIKYDPGSGTELDGNLEEDIEEVMEEEAQQVSQQENEENQAYDCDSCTKTFKRKEHLFQHRKSHSGERPFICKTCNKAFSRKEHLLRHNVSHTGQKLYGCDVCHKTFSRKDNLHKHKKTHGIGGPHICEVCGKSFVVKHYYIMHKAQHEGQGGLSGADSSPTGTTVKHLTSTSSTVNPLPHRCDLCSKSFSMKQYLDSHRLRHRSKNKQEPQQEQHQQQEALQQEPAQEQQVSGADITIPQPTILTSYPTNLATLNTGLTTINPSALLAPNIIHHSGANMVHIGNNSYICTAGNVTSEILEQYRRLHAS